MKLRIREKHKKQYYIEKIDEENVQKRNRILDLDELFELFNPEEASFVEKIYIYHLKFKFDDSM